MTRIPQSTPLPPPLDALLRPEIYPHHPPSVELIQTHASWVFLAGPEVFKVKKPVRFSFLDFSTLDRRRDLCHDEVRLNRRLAPRTYLGVVAIVPVGPDRVRLAGAEDPAAVEYAVHMRRLPEEHILARILERGGANRDDIQRLARHLERFHRTAATGPEISANGSPEAIAAILRENFETVARFRGLTIDPSDDEEIQRWAWRFLDDHRELLVRRCQSKRIRDCHGDLHAEHVCLIDPPEIFDCIEFNTRFRFIDVASDIAFLSMDLRFHDRADLADALLRAYVEEGGDEEVFVLAPFYECYRAYVRGKVDSLTASEPEVPEPQRESALRGARAHFELALRYTWSGRPVLVVMSGLSGSGKSTVASRLARRTGFLHINSDRVRKELAGLAANETRPDLYTPERSEQTYRTMREKAAAALAEGRGVILDATFMRRVDRDVVRAMAHRLRVPLLFVECRCSEAEVYRRLHRRQTERRDASDADWSVYLRQRRNFDAFADDETDRVILDTSRPLDALIRLIESRLRQVQADARQHPEG